MRLRLTEDEEHVLHRLGGWGAANRAFAGQLEPLLVEINAAVAA